MMTGTKKPLPPTWLRRRRRRIRAKEEVSSPRVESLPIGSLSKAPSDIGDVSFEMEWVDSIEMLSIEIVPPELCAAVQLQSRRQSLILHTTFAGRSQKKVGRNPNTYDDIGDLPQ